MPEDEKNIEEHEGEAVEGVVEDAAQPTEPGGSEDDQLAEQRDKYLRVLAEFDNFRKRTAKEKAGMYDDGLVDAVAKFLPVIDNLGRALDSAGERSDDPLYKGVDMILSQLLKTLGELGVEQISAVGEVFDPNRHFAVAHAQDANVSENTVVEELQKGYKYKDKILRHSMVKVAN